MKKQSKIDEYCIYCGEDAEKHSERCPLIYGVRANSDGYVCYGFKIIPNDPEWNLNLGRASILFAFGNHGLGPENKKIKGRLLYEHIRYHLERLNANIIGLLDSVEKSRNPIKQFIAKRKIGKLEKTRESLLGSVKVWSNDVEKEYLERINELFSSSSEFDIHRKISKKHKS